MNQNYQWTFLCMKKNAQHSVVIEDKVMKFFQFCSCLVSGMYTEPSMFAFSNADIENMFSLVKSNKRYFDKAILKNSLQNTSLN